MSSNKRTSTNVAYPLSSTDNDGPDFCQPSDDEEEFCSGNDDQDGRDCDSDSVCTSSCQCWDGRTMQMEDQVTFDLDGIQDQGIM